MLMAYLTFFTGIAISLVAIYYSVMGLTAIFAAAVVPIVIMGTILEVAKLVTTVWLKQNWSRAPLSLKGYLSVAVVVLMVITSMGIFGFLSKAHSDQGLVSGDVQSKIAIYDEKIKTAKDNIDANRKAIKQMDDAVDQTMVRSTTEGGADKAVQIRRSQQKERARLAQDIEAEQKKINQLMDERAPIAAEVRAVEAEVGPIKYIAALIYGDNPDQNILEKAVTWVIITIIFVFDPLAVLLLLASQYSFAWISSNKKDSPSDQQWSKFFSEPPADNFPEPAYTYNEFEKPTAEELAEIDEINRAEEANALLADIEKEPETEVFVEEPIGIVAQEVIDVLPDVVVKDETTSQISVEQLNKILDDAGLEVLNNTKKLTKVVDLPVSDLSSPERFGLNNPKKEEIEFPENPFLGQQLTLKDRVYIFNGKNWVESPLNHRDDVNIERPGDYVVSDETNSKKKNYMTKDQDGNILIKTTK